MMDLRMYILVNSDIKISKGKLVGQVGHAVQTYNYINIDKHRNLIEKYMNNYQKKIILKCDSETLEKLEKDGHIAIRDAGFTELKENTLTCVNLGILDFENIPETLKFIKDLKIL